jgi:hypothetical protein
MQLDKERNATSTPEVFDQLHIVKTTRNCALPLNIRA